MFIKKINNSIIKAFNFVGLHLIKSRYSRWQFELYREKKILYNQPKYINIGAGSFYHPLWHNIDMPNQFYKHAQTKPYINCDISKKEKIKVKSNTINLFYTSHLIEHLSDPDVEFMFNEVFRMLKKKGFFRITCPDMELQYLAYKNKDLDFWTNLHPWGRHSSIEGSSLEHRFVQHFATCLCDKDRFKDLFIKKEEIIELFKSHKMNDFFNIITSKIPKGMNSLFPEGHINWFTFDKLSSMLKKVGFSSVLKSAYLQSKEPIMRDPRLFDATCPELSFYVEAIK
jgi:predicted SAM-dependent methyltransferase